MKIKFTKLPTTVGTIKVSLDGGQSFTEHNIADIYESGVPLEDSQDYEKIQIQGASNVLKNLNVVSSVKVEGESAEAIIDDIVFTYQKNLDKITVTEPKNGYVLETIDDLSTGDYPWEIWVLDEDNAYYVGTKLDEVNNYDYENGLKKSFEKIVGKDNLQIGLVLGGNWSKPKSYEGNCKKIVKNKVIAILNEEPAGPEPTIDVEQPVSEEQVTPRYYKAVKNYYISKKNTENYKADDTEYLINVKGWYVPPIEISNTYYKFIGTDSINGLGIFAVVAEAGYYINEEGSRAIKIMDDGVSDEIDYETGFYIPVSEQTEDSSYVAICNTLETTWYVAYKNNHIVDGQCEVGYLPVEYNGIKNYTAPDSLYNCENIAPRPVCELEDGALLLVVRASKGYSVVDGVMAEEIDEVVAGNIDTPHKINYITGYWKLP